MRAYPVRFPMGSISHTVHVPKEDCEDSPGSQPGKIKREETRRVIHDDMTTGKNVIKKKPRKNNP